jgi:hypothetical protein
MNAYQLQSLALDRIRESRRQADAARTATAARAARGARSRTRRGAHRTERGA